MKKIIQIYYVFSLLLGTSVYLAQKSAMKLPKVIQFYLNDFLIIPILLISSLFVLRWSKNDENYQIPVWIIGYVCCAYALFYEFFLPKFNPRYTADIIDVLLYFSSGFLFFKLQKTTKKYKMISDSLKWLKANAKTEVKVVPELKLAYIPYQGNINLIGNVYGKLMQWALPKGLMQQKDLRMVTIYHDSIKNTDIDKIRVSACMTLNIPVETSGEVKLKTQPKRRCIVSRLEISLPEFKQAWESSYAWMHTKGYKKGAQDSFAIYYNNPEEHPEGKSIVDICIPIQ